MVDDTDTEIVPSYEIGSFGIYIYESSQNEVLDFTITSYEISSVLEDSSLEVCIPTVIIGITSYEIGHTADLIIEEGEKIVSEGVTSYDSGYPIDWEVKLLDENDTAIVLVGNWDTLDFVHGNSRLEIQGIPQYGVNEIYTTFTAVFLESENPL